MKPWNQSHGSLLSMRSPKASPPPGWCQMVSEVWMPAERALARYHGQAQHSLISTRSGILAHRDLENPE